MIADEGSKLVFINALSAKIGGGRTYIINLLKYYDYHDTVVYIACEDRSILPVGKENLIYFESDFANKNILFRAFWEFFKLPKILTDLKVDVLFVPGGMDFTLKNKRFKKVTMFRNMLPFDFRMLKTLSSKILKVKNRVLRYLMIRTMNSADHVIFISHYARSNIINSLNLKGHSVIYHGISDMFNYSDEPIEALFEKKYILYVSRFEVYKNHLTLIKAYNLLPEKLKNSYQLILVGEAVESVTSKCLDYIKCHGLESNVVILGKVEYEKLPTIYQNSSLFVFPSSCENCPNILLEAIGCGAAIASSDYLPMPEFAGDSALYFDTDDEVSICNVIEEVLTDDKLRNDLIGKSKTLRKEYMWENTAAKTWQCLKLQAK